MPYPNETPCPCSNDPNKAGSLASILNNFRGNGTGSHMTQAATTPSPLPASPRGLEAIVEVFQGKTVVTRICARGPGSLSWKGPRRTASRALHGFWKKTTPIVHGRRQVRSYQVHHSVIVATGVSRRDTHPWNLGLGSIPLSAKPVRSALQCPRPRSTAKHGPSFTHDFSLPYTEAIHREPPTPLFNHAAPHPIGNTP